MINKSKLKLVISLMAAAAVIIIGIAVYVFINFSQLELLQGIILAVIGIVALFIIMGVVTIMMRSMTSSNKTADTKK